MKFNPTHIGRIESVSGNTVAVRLENTYPSNMPVVNGVVYRIGQVGSFLKVPLGFANLFGVVTQAGASAIPEGLLVQGLNAASLGESNQWLRMILIGEQVGRRFERGVLQSPTTGDPVHLVTNDDLKLIYGGYDDSSSIVIGHLSASESLAARLDLDRLVSRHSAVLGATGSGKSNAVSVILSAIADKALPSARVLVIDPHGEYSEALAGRCCVLKIGSTKSDKTERSLVVPFWALPFRELMSIFSGRLKDTSEDYIRSKVLELKKEWAKGVKGLRDEAITADSPIPFSIHKLWFDLDDFERMTFKADRSTKEDLKAKGDASTLVSNVYPTAGIGSSAPFLNNRAQGILSFLVSMRNRLVDSRYAFLFQPGTYSPDLSGKVSSDLSSLLQTWFDHGMPVTILDLSEVPSEIRQSVSGSILKILYDALYWGQATAVGGKKQPMLAVLDEAHSYLKAGEDSISSRTVQAIAKEGRKYGVGVMLVTQRPSELDETVLSQCGSIVALRMTNGKDKAQVTASVQDELKEMTDLLSSLRTGEAIISGEAVRIPSRIRFYHFGHSQKRSDPLPSKLWKEQKPNMADYDTAVLNWRNQTLK
ncbi:MAG: ATP-binding protein [Flavobacteriales bacterium]